MGSATGSVLKSNTEFYKLRELRDEVMELDPMGIKAGKDPQC